MERGNELTSTSQRGARTVRISNQHVDSDDTTRLERQRDSGISFVTVRMFVISYRKQSKREAQRTLLHSGPQL